MYGTDLNQISAIPHGGAALGVVGGAGLTALGAWQAAVLFAVVLFSVAALWTIASVVVHRARR